jgi:hypothetical protein
MAGCRSPEAGSGFVLLAGKLDAGLPASPDLRNTLTDGSPGRAGGCSSSFLFFLLSEEAAPTALSLLLTTDLTTDSSPHHGSRLDPSAHWTWALLALVLEPVGIRIWSTGTGIDPARDRGPGSVRDWCHRNSRPAGDGTGPARGVDSLHPPAGNGDRPSRSAARYGSWIDRHG